MGRHTQQNMASGLARNWVTFDQEEVTQKSAGILSSDPWPISGISSSAGFLSRPLSSSSDSSSVSSMPTSSLDSRGASPLHNSEEDSKYLAFKLLQNPAHSEPDNDDISEPSSSCSMDSKYSVFSSLRECEEKGEYLGWSKKVLGEAMGWSETLKAKPAF